MVPESAVFPTPLYDPEFSISGTNNQPMFRSSHSIRPRRSDQNSSHLDAGGVVVQVERARRSGGRRRAGHDDGRGRLGVVLVAGGGVLAGHHREEQLPVPLPAGHRARSRIDSGQQQDETDVSRAWPNRTIFARQVPDGSAGSDRAPSGGPGEVANCNALPLVVEGLPLARSRIATCV